MNKTMFIKTFLLTIVILILGIDLFTDYTLNKWIKAIGFLFLSILALIDLIKKNDWFCKLRSYDVLNKTLKMDDISEILQIHNRVKKNYYEQRIFNNFVSDYYNWIRSTI